MKNSINKYTKGATLNSTGTIYVLDSKVYCEGEDEISRHPKVFLQISGIKEKEPNISCPYCKQIFIFQKKDAKKYH